MAAGRADQEGKGEGGDGDGVAVEAAATPRPVAGGQDGGRMDAFGGFYACVLSCCCPFAALDNVPRARCRGEWTRPCIPAVRLARQSAQGWMFSRKQLLL